MQRLDNRLRLCAEFVRKGARVADIGTDHAYLPVWLCQCGISPCAIAADINPEPLSRGALTITEAGLENRITARLSDGLEQFGEDDADDIVIAGMGGELIAKIIGAWNYSKNENKHFILQPMTKSELLISWLAENGFEILRQECCEAAGKSYTVLLARFNGETAEHDELFPYLGKIDLSRSEGKIFVEREISRLRKQAIGDPKYGELADALEEKIKL